jgi:hypothetical protein
MNKTELILLGDEDATKVTFRMKKDLLRKLKVHAAQNDTNVTDVLNKLVEEYLGSYSKHSKTKTNLEHEEESFGA